VPHRRSQYCGCTDEQYYIAYCSYVERPGQQLDNVAPDGIVKASIIFFISFYDIGWRVSQVAERGQIMQNSGFKLDKLDLQRSFVSLGIADILQKGNTSSRQLWHLQKGIVKWAIESKLEVGELVLKVSMSLYDREFDSRTYLKDNGESLWLFPRNVANT
jgi:hypothetical protein